MKIPSALKTLVGIPAAIWVTLRLQIPWDVLFTTVSSAFYIVSRFFLFIVPLVVFGFIKWLIAFLTSKK